MACVRDSKFALDSRVQALSKASQRVPVAAPHAGAANAAAAPAVPVEVAHQTARSKEFATVLAKLEAMDPSRFGPILAITAPLLTSIEADPSLVTSAVVGIDLTHSMALFSAGLKKPSELAVTAGTPPVLRVVTCVPCGYTCSWLL
jgi:hypothetical protein